MFRNLQSVLAVLLVVASVPSAQAADAQGNFAVWGVGAKSCHNFNQALKAGDIESHRNYVMGYLTAYNFLADDTYKIGSGMNLEQIMEWIANYCQMKPVNGFEQAISDFTAEQAPKRLTHAPNRPGN